MTQRKIRVLLDMSLAMRGYSGIPQDTRLLFKTLSQCSEVEVTGLLTPTFHRMRQHRFCPPGAPRSERVANQACFLWGINEPHGPHGSFPKRAAMRLWSEARMRLTRRAKLEEADMSVFSHVIWRSLFAQTLTADDFPMVCRSKFRFMDVAGETMHRRTVAGLAPVRVDTTGFDFLIVQTTRPMRISPETKLVVRYHDMIPMLQADATPFARDIRWHHRGIKQCAGGYFVCNSDPTRDNLIDVYPELTDRAHTVPYMLSDAYRPESSSSLINSIIRTRRSGATGVGPRRPLKRTPRYIMGVSTLEPRKNFPGLIQAYNTARFRSSMQRAAPNLKLLIVGGPGWKQGPILDAMRELVARGDVIHLEGVTPDELRALYSHAEALVYPSHAEGFGFPPVEAMQCEVPVIASDIPEHRWVLGDAAMYCNSYDVNSIADSIEQLIASEEAPTLRRELVARGLRRIERYSLEQCRDQWVDLLDRLQSGKQPQSSMPATTPFVSVSKDRAA